MASITAIDEARLRKERAEIASELRFRVSSMLVGQGRQWTLEQLRAMVKLAANAEH